MDLVGGEIKDLWRGFAKSKLNFVSLVVKRCSGMEVAWRAIFFSLVEYLNKILFLQRKQKKNVSVERVFICPYTEDKVFNLYSYYLQKLGKRVRSARNFS